MCRLGSGLRLVGRIGLGVRVSVSFQKIIPAGFYPTAARRGVAMTSGVTPTGQGWTNARGLRGLGGPSLTLNFFVYFNISSVRCQPSILLYRLQLILCERPTLVL